MAVLDITRCFGGARLHHQKSWGATSTCSPCAATPSYIHTLQSCTNVHKCTYICMNVHTCTRMHARTTYLCIQAYKLISIHMYAHAHILQAYISSHTPKHPLPHTPVSTAAANSTINITRITITAVEQNTHNKNDCVQTCRVLPSYRVSYPGRYVWWSS